MAVDLGHWDATHAGGVGMIADNPQIDRGYAVALLSTNTLSFYGDRLRSLVEVTADSPERQAPLEDFA